MPSVPLKGSVRRSERVSGLPGVCTHLNLERLSGAFLKVADVGDPRDSGRRSLDMRSRTSLEEVKVDDHYGSAVFTVDIDGPLEAPEPMPSWTR